MMMSAPRKVAACLALVAALAGAGAAPASPSTAVGVTTREFRFGVFRASVPPGWVRFNVTNRGEDVHNLQVTLDFRALYSSALEQWLQTGADEVIPNARAYGRVPIVR